MTWQNSNKPTYPSLARKDVVYDELARHLVAKRTTKEISEAMGLAIPEIMRLQSLQDFRAYLHKYQKRVFRGADRKLASRYNYIVRSQNRCVKLLPKALKALEEIITNPNENGNARLKAIEFVAKIADLGPLQHGEDDKKFSPEMVAQLQVVINESKGRTVEVNPAIDVEKVADAPSGPEHQAVG